jgi:tetratricopeptide (TPR) repeat protein
VRVSGPIGRLTVLVALCATWACQRGPAVPDLASYGTLDPAVAQLVTDDLEALAEAPADANRWGVLGLTLDANGLTPRAEDAYRTATTLPVSHGRWWYHLARLRARAGDADAALAAFDQAIAKSPDYPPARWRKAQLLFDRGDHAGAEAAFRVAANLAPDDVTAAIGLARVQLATGRAADAAASLEALLARVPTDRYAYQVLATTYRALGKAREADEAAAAGASGTPQPADPWLDEMGEYRRGFASML